MASLSQLIPGGFNSQAIEPQAARDDAPLPPGLYSAEITNAEVKPLKSGTGTGLNLEFTVIDPEQYARRKVWMLLCIVHENAQTQDIAQAQLSALCRAVGIGVLEDTDQFFQRIVKIRTKVRPAQGNYGPKAEVSAFEPAGTALPPTPGKPSAPAPAAAKAPPPWSRKAA
jgi:Protein of unknown function (DUF669)